MRAADRGVPGRSRSRRSPSRGFPASGRSQSLSVAPWPGTVPCERWNISYQARVACGDAVDEDFEFEVVAAGGAAIGPERHLLTQFGGHQQRAARRVVRRRKAFEDVVEIERGRCVGAPGGVFDEAGAFDQLERDVDAGGEFLADLVAPALENIGPRPRWYRRKRRSRSAQPVRASGRGRR